MAPSRVGGQTFSGFAAATGIATAAGVAALAFGLAKVLVIVLGFAVLTGVPGGLVAFTGFLALAVFLIFVAGTRLAGFLALAAATRFTALTGFFTALRDLDLVAFGVLRLATAFGFAVLLRAALFFAGFFRGKILYQLAGLHQTAGQVPLG